MEEVIYFLLLLFPPASPPAAACAAFLAAFSWSAFASLEKGEKTFLEDNF